MSLLNNHLNGTAGVAIKLGVDLGESWGRTTRDMKADNACTGEAGTKGFRLERYGYTLAAKADQWIRPRPATDMALALGMIHVIINEGLYDKAFVENWTIGFDELKAHVQDYSPQRVSEISWVPAETIVDAARFYAANRPAAVLVGNANENIVLSMQAQRAIYILEGLCGNVGALAGYRVPRLPECYHRQHRPKGLPE